MEYVSKTSYVMVPPEVEGWRRVTVETAPFADNMHTALGPCCANPKSFDAISWEMLKEERFHYFR